MNTMSKEANHFSQFEQELFDKLLKVFPPLKIGAFTHPFGIVQGGMGINISTFRLPPAITNLGCLGTMSSANVKSFVPYELTESEQKLPFKEKSAISTYKALKNLCLSCMKKSDGPLNVNIMIALEDYTESVKAVCDAKREMPEYQYPLRIVSGAGLPLTLQQDLLKFDGQSIGVEYGFISSTPRGANLLLKRYLKRNSDYLPTFIVVEGPASGGHQGCKLRDIINDESLITIANEEGTPRYAGYFDVERAPTLESLVEGHAQLLLNDYPDERVRNIPIIAAGGIWDNDDMLRVLKAGASGIQIGTRLVCTDECDASQAYKDAVIDANKEDILLIESPAKRFALSVVKSPMIAAFLDPAKENLPYGCKSWLLGDLCTTRGKKEYCLCDNLTLGGVSGDKEKMLVTIGQNGYRVNKISSAHEIIFRYLFGEETDFQQYGYLLDKFRIERIRLINSGLKWR
jgi:nitronate monooxygenase